MTIRADPHQILEPSGPLYCDSDGYCRAALGRTSDLTRESLSDSIITKTQGPSPICLLSAGLTIVSNAIWYDACTWKYTEPTVGFFHTSESGAYHHRKAKTPTLKGTNSSRERLRLQCRKVVNQSKRVMAQ